MASQAWLNDVRRRMAERGLPPAYIRRFMDELADHLEDLNSENLTEENMSTEMNATCRLGDANQLADTAVTAYHRRSFLGRHATAAFLVFGLSPIAVVLILASIGIGGMLLSDAVADWIGVDIGQFLRSLKRFDPLASVVLSCMVSLLVVAIPSILASVFYCKLGTRLGMGKKWILVSCVVLAATALMPICSAQLSDIPGESRLAVGTWNPLHIEHLFGTIVWCFCNPRQLSQFLVPLAIGGWFMRRARLLRVEESQTRLAT